MLDAQINPHPSSLVFTRRGEGMNLDTERLSGNKAFITEGLRSYM
jgi:hypothetical protein